MICIGELVVLATKGVVKVQLIKMVVVVIVGSLVVVILILILGYFCPLPPGSE